MDMLPSNKDQSLFEECRTSLLCASFHDRRGKSNGGYKLEMVCTTNYKQMYMNVNMYMYVCVGNVNALMSVICLQ